MSSFDARPPYRTIPEHVREWLEACLVGLFQLGRLFRRDDNKALTTMLFRLVWGPHGKWKLLAAATAILIFLQMIKWTVFYGLVNPVVLSNGALEPPLKLVGYTGWLALWFLFSPITYLSLVAGLGLRRLARSEFYRTQILLVPEMRPEVFDAIGRQLLLIVFALAGLEIGHSATASLLAAHRTGQSFFASFMGLPWDATFNSFTIGLIVIPRLFQFLVTPLFPLFLLLVVVIITVGARADEKALPMGILATALGSILGRSAHGIAGQLMMGFGALVTRYHGPLTTDGVFRVSAFSVDLVFNAILLLVCGGLWQWARARFIAHPLAIEME